MPNEDNYAPVSGEEEVVGGQMIAAKYCGCLPKKKCARHDFASKDRQRIRSIRDEVIRIGKNRCAVCRESLKGREHMRQLDHITPVGLGGKTELANMQVICHHCHREKTRKDQTKIRREYDAWRNGRPTYTKEAWENYLMKQKRGG